MMEKEKMNKDNVESTVEEAVTTDTPNKEIVSPEAAEVTTNSEATTTEVTETKAQEKKISDKKEAKVSTESKDEKHSKHKKRKNMTVEEVLAAGNVLEKDELGNDKVKIHVKQKSKLKRREARMGYLFIFPWIIGAALFLIYPMARSFYFMLCNVTNSPLTGLRAVPVGFKNFSDIMEYETTIITDIGAFVTRMIISVPVIVVFSLLMAMLLNLKLPGRGIFRTIYFLPVIVVSGPVMAMLTGEGAGSISAIDTTSITNTINEVLPNFIASGTLWALNNIIIILWYAGVQILIFLAAIQKIDTSLYEAAKIDGGSGWECFWKITLPTIKPMILLNAMYTLIFLSGDTNSNGIIVLIKTCMLTPRKGFGYATAMAWMYSIVVLILVGIIALLFAPKKDAYFKQIKKQKKLEKKTRKHLKKLQKQMAKNNAKFAKHVAKQEQAKAAGKKVKGGRE